MLLDVGRSKRKKRGGGKTNKCLKNAADQNTHKDKQSPEKKKGRKKYCAETGFRSRPKQKEFQYPVAREKKKSFPRRLSRFILCRDAQKEKKNEGEGNRTAPRPAALFIHGVARKGGKKKRGKRRM